MEMAMSIDVIFKILFFGCFVAFGELKPVTLDPNAEPIILVRLKRAPNRAFTFSGFNPNTGLSAFATSADYLPSYYRYVPSPPAPSPPPPPSSYSVQGPGHEETSYLPSGESDSSYNYPPSVEFPSVVGSEEDRKIPSPSQNLTPPAEITPVNGYGANANPIPPAPPKKPKKKPNRVNPAPIEEEEDAEENEGRSRSSSSASFNAWFPIVLGSYPANPSGSRSNPESYKDEISAPYKEKPGSTVIANSVSNGRSGVASSHAVLYGGESPVQSYRRG